MPKNGLNVALKGVDEIFSTEESRHAEQREQVQQIPIAELFPFKTIHFGCKMTKKWRTLSKASRSTVC